MPTHSPIGLPIIPSPVVADPLIGFSADGVVIKSVVRVQAGSRTYLAQRVATGEDLRVQVVAEHLARDVAFVARFRREADQLAELHHVHVETYVSHRTWSTPTGGLVLALLSELTAGVTLSHLVRRDRLPVCDVLRIFHQACDGLAAAHRMGIVHGDVTPEAIVVTPGGAAKLCGFALGATGYAAGRIEHSVTGSPEFMAPEVCRGQQPSSLSDLYSMGAALVTILTGEVPFPARTALECIHLQNTAAVPNLAISHPEFSLVAPVIQRMMAKDPAPRWIAADELARELLVLSGQMSPEIRCCAPNENRQLHLAALVQSALADVPLAASTVTSVSGAEPSPSATASGGTTTISRKSVDFFRNPELYKPSGMTPAAGLPILPAAVNERPATRTVRRVETAVQRSAVVTPSVPQSTVEVQPTALVTPHTPPVLNQRWVWAGTAAALVLVVAFVVFSIAPGQKPAVSSSGEMGSQRPSPTSSNAVQAQAEALTPVLASNNPPGQWRSALDEKIAAIATLGLRDPAAALAQAQTLRQENPTEKLPGLPLPLRLVVVGPQAKDVRISQSGAAVARTPDLVLCRVRGQLMDVQIAAEGFRTQDVAVQEGPMAGEQVCVVVMLNEPRWSQPPFSPTWVRLFSFPSGIVLASDRKVVLISAEDGQERARLDHAMFSALPVEGLTWASAQPASAETLHLGVTGGLCLKVGVTQTFHSVQEVHRGQTSVLQTLRLPLILRLGEEGIFALERTALGIALVADSHQRRLWSRPLVGNQVPWLMVEGDHVLVVGDGQVQRISQEGEEQAHMPLPGPRTAAPLLVPEVGLLIPTQAGLACIARFTATPHLVPGLPAVPVSAVVSGPGRVTIAGLHEVSTYTIVDGALQLRWSQPEVVAIDRHIVYLVDAGDVVIAVEDTGVIRSFRVQDGALVRTVRPGVPLLTAPLPIAAGWVVVEAPGVIRLY